MYGWSCEKSGNKTGMKMCVKTTLHLLHDGWILVLYAKKVLELCVQSYLDYPDSVGQTHFLVCLYMLV